MDFLNDLNVIVTPNAKLAKFTTFRLGGPCPYLIECTKSVDLTEAVKRLREHIVEFILIGFGSNLLISDKGLPKVVVRYSSDTPLIQKDSTNLIVEASSQLDDICTFAAQQGLKGMTKFNGIPGTLGGAIFGNAGAYGEAISDYIKDVIVMKPSGQCVCIDKKDIAFSYRDSEFKRNENIILSATLILQKGDSAALLQERDALLQERYDKHGHWLEDTPCAGSFFKNIAKTSLAEKNQSAGSLLEQSGVKNIKVGNAFVYQKHANIITHKNGSAKDVLKLTFLMQKAVKEKFGIKLEPEVRILGF